LLTRAQMRSLAGSFQDLLETAQHRADRLNRMQLLTEAALAHLPLDQLLPKLLQRAIEVLPADLALILLLDEESQMLETRAGIGWDEEIAKRRKVPFGQGISGAIAQSGQLRIIDDLAEAEVFNPILKERAASLIGVPLVVEHQVIGVILVGSKEPRKFSQEEAGLLQIVADRIALTVDRKRAEEELAGVAHRYRSLFDHLAEGLAHCQVIFDEQGNAVDFIPLDVNQAFGKLTGLADITGKHVTEVVPGIRQQNPELFEICGRVASTGRPERFDLELKPLGIWFSNSVYSPRQGEFVALFDNITERKRAEEALRSSEERWATTLQSIADAVISTDAKGCVVFMNEVAQNLTGWAMEEAKGKPLHEVYHVVQEVTRIRAQDAVSKVLQLGKIVGLANHSLLLRRDGTEIPVEDAAAPIQDRAKPDQIEGVVLVFHDVSTQRRAEQAVRSSERLATTGRLAATIAHEIHNPLDTVGNLLYLMEQEVKPSEPADGLPANGEPEAAITRLQEFVTLAAQELARVTQMTQQMLSFQRDAIRPTPVKMNEILPSVHALYDRRLRSARIHFEKEIEFAGEIIALPGEMRQIFANLVGNAIDAVAAQPGAGAAGVGVPSHSDSRAILSAVQRKPSDEMPGRIRLRAHASREWRTDRSGLRVVIADNGPGIPAGIRDKIFHPFFTTKGENGTGLGLWVTSDIVRKYGGTIRLRSITRPGRTGTCFSVFFPFQEQGDS
jgi:PAS domain S-box-containing protein